MAYLPLIYRIQEIDSRLLVLQKEQDQARKNPNLAALELLRKELEKSLSEKTEARTKLQKDQRRLELDLKSCTEHLRQDEQKLYGGTVASSRELEQIQHKTEEYAAKKNQLEDELIRIMENEETLVAETDLLTKRLENCRREMELIRGNIEEKLFTVKLETGELEQERRSLAAEVPVEMLERYQKLARAKHGVGIARVKGDGCGGCHVSLPESILRQVRRGEDQFIYCENCGRILYF